MDKSTSLTYSCCIIDPGSCKAVEGGKCLANCDPGPSGELYTPVDGNCYTSGLRCCVPYEKSAGGVEGAPTKAGPTKTDTIRTEKSYTYKAPLGNLSVNQIVGRVIQNVFPIIGALLLFMFLWGGVQWIMAGGDSKKVTSARDTLVHAFIGMVIILSAYLIVSNILNIASQTLTPAAGGVTVKPS